jgi:hypothetical protein
MAEVSDIERVVVFRMIYAPPGIVLSLQETRRPKNSCAIRDGHIEARICTITTPGHLVSAILRMAAPKKHALVFYCTTRRVNITPQGLKAVNMIRDAYRRFGQYR